MDAGPNVHLLYPKNEEANISPWLENNIRPLCHQQLIIFDEIGDGPEKSLHMNFKKTEGLITNEVKY